MERHDGPQPHDLTLMQDQAGLQLMFTSNPLPMWLYDPETLRILAVNHAAVDTYGFSRDEFLCMTILDLRPPEDRAQLEAYVAAPRASFRKAGEWRHRLRTGKVIEVEITSHTMALQGRSVVLVVANDITDRKRVERELRKSTAHLTDMLAVQRDLVACDGNLDDLYHRIVTHALRLTNAEGAVIEWVTGDEVAYVHAAGTLEHFIGNRDPLQNSLSGHSIRTGEVLRCNDTERDNRVNVTVCRAMGVRSVMVAPLLHAGTVFATLKVVAQPPGAFTAADGRYLELLASSVGTIIRRRQVETELQAVNGELEARVANRTAQLQAANKELEAFSYSVSHDLRAPLRAINGFARILQEEFAPHLSEDIREYLTLIRSNATQMGLLIDDLLAFSRLSRQPLNTGTVNLGTLARQALQNLEPEMQWRQVEVTVEPLPDCQADPSLMRQVLANLLSNALKFTRKRTVATVTLSSHQSPDEHVFCVRDNGTGFDPRHQNKLFEVFQRLHLAEEYEGTGVGLAIVKRIIVRHGGRVWAEGALDQGACFFFSLPKHPHEVPSRGGREEGQP